MVSVYMSRLLLVNGSHGYYLYTLFFFLFVPRRKLIYIYFSFLSINVAKSKKMYAKKFTRLCMYKKSIHLSCYLINVLRFIGYFLDTWPPTSHMYTNPRQFTPNFNAIKYNICTSFTMECTGNVYLSPYDFVTCLWKTLPTNVICLPPLPQSLSHVTTTKTLTH